MTSDPKKDSLMGLFSTRATQDRAFTTRQIKRPVSQGGTGTVTVPIVNNQSSTTTTSSVGNSNTGGTRTTRAQLSPFASTIMRETRRELGADQGAQGRQDGQVTEAHIAAAVDKVLKRRAGTIDDIERANIIIHLQKDLLGWGVLQPLIDNQDVTDIHCYDYQTVVLQRGKNSELTGLHWPNQEAYVAFIDRILMRMGKSLSTQQHTIDSSFPNGIRICAVHESVCGARGPFLTIRVPRIIEASLESLITYQVAPPLIINYLACLVRSGLCTMMVAGETGVGKTTLMRCLGTQFGPDESIIAVEDTPELNFQHAYFRSLVSRTANTEGMGEVTLQEHIKTTLRLTPTRVILGEMRTPFAAEAFLESAQTGHVGMSTIHARNAKETLVRLESLLGRAQKSVSIEIIRQQIALAVDVVIWLFREKGTGKVRIGEIIEVGHYVEGAIQIRPMFSMLETGERPVWKLNSWSSNFETILSQDGILLGEYPEEISLNSVGPTSDGAKR